MNGNSYTSFLAILVIFIAFLNIRNRLIKGFFLSSVSGLSLTFAIFFGLGTLSYLSYGVVFDGRKFYIIQESINEVFPYLFFGFIFASLLDYLILLYLTKPKSILEEIKFIKKPNRIHYFCISILLLSFLATTLKNQSLSQASFGTIIPVLANFLYPVCILIIYFLKRKTFPIFNLIALLLTIGINAFFSAWRSGLIMLGASALIGLSLRSKWQYYIYIIPLAFVLMFYVLPFQQIKRLSIGNSNVDIVTLFNETLKVPFKERFKVIGIFSATRLNYSREIGFVQNGIHNDKIQYRNGETYIEVLLQLIPRIFWPEKPVYNYYTGYELPRQISLLSREDLGTSWAVNCFAEFIYNFSYKNLVYFIPVLFLFFQVVDYFASRMNLLPQYKFLLTGTLFFLTLNLVSLIYSATYFLWTFIVVWLFNLFSNIIYYENPTLRRIS